MKFPAGAAFEFIGVFPYARKCRSVTMAYSGTKCILEILKQGKFGLAKLLSFNLT